MIAGIDFAQLTIDVIIMEGPFDGKPAQTLLRHGYERIDYLGRPCRGQSVYVRRTGGFRLGIERAGLPLMPAAPWFNDAFCVNPGRPA